MHSALIGGATSKIQTIVMSSRLTDILVSFVRTARSKHSTTSESSSVKIVTFTQALLDLASKIRIGSTVKSISAVNKNVIHNV